MTGKEQADAIIDAALNGAKTVRAMFGTGVPSHLALSERLTPLWLTSRSSQQC